MEESLRIQREEDVPSAIDFTARIESRNIPAVSFLSHSTSSHAFLGLRFSVRFFNYFSSGFEGYQWLRQRLGSCIEVESNERRPGLFAGFSFCSSVLSCFR